MIDKIGIHTPANLQGKADAGREAGGKDSPSFSKMLMEAIDSLNQQQIEAEQMTQKLITGEVQDLHQVMIAAQKANLSLQMALQVRNKVVEAYQEIMRMPI